MRQIIGFDRRLELAWLDATIGFCQQDLSASWVVRRLREHLGLEIAGEEARRKTITVLLRIWVNVPAREGYLRDEALKLATEIAPEERLWLHWGMSLLAYPFFRDVAATVGQLSRLQGAVRFSQVQRRMIESWGERTTLRRAVQRLLRSLVEWGALQDTDERGSYDVVPSRQTSNAGLALWFLGCALRANGSEQIPLRGLAQLPYAFPFDLLPFTDDMRRSRRFEVYHQGLDLEMVASAGVN